jgi:hypothetical protein
MTGFRRFANPADRHFSRGETWPPVVSSAAGGSYFVVSRLPVLLDFSGGKSMRIGAVRLSARHHVQRFEPRRAKSLRLREINISGTPAKVVCSAVGSDIAAGFGGQVWRGLGLVDDAVRELPTWVRLQYGMKCPIAGIGTGRALRSDQAAIFDLRASGLGGEGQPSEFRRIWIPEIHRQRAGEGSLLYVRQFSDGAGKDRTLEMGPGHRHPACR